MTEPQWGPRRDRLPLQDETPAAASEPDGMPYSRPGEDSVESQYRTERGRAPGGSGPRRITPPRRALVGR